MSEQNVPNGLPPQQKLPMQRPFNGVDSSQSSRDSSPGRFNHIPLNQMPPQRPQIPPQNLSQSFGQLNISGKQGFSTSTPLIQSPVGFGSSNLPPVSAVPPRMQNGPPVAAVAPQSQPRMPPLQNVPLQPQSSLRVAPPTVPVVNSSPSKPLHANRYPSVNQYQNQQNLNMNQQNFSQNQQSFHQNQQVQQNSYQSQQNQHNSYQNQQNLYQNQQNLYQNQPNMYQNQQNMYQVGQLYNQSVTKTGFSKLWGNESADLLQTPNILPPVKVEPPKVSLGQDYLDAANCSSDLFRCTMTKIPETNSLLQKSRLPLGVLIHPFKDLNQLSVIQCNVIVRCRACRTYINPFVFFLDTKRWKCNLCYRVNELPEEFQFDPISRTYGDPSRRPEIKTSTIEYIAPAEYMLRPPQPAIYLYLFDVTRLAVESGYLHTVCDILQSQLEEIPGDARTQIGFIAYDSALHFFFLGENSNQPHEMTVLDIDDVFLPSPDNLLVNLKDRAELINDLLMQLPTRYANTFETRSALGAALQAAHKLMSATGGRVTVFQASLPNIGPGALTSREDPSQRASSEAQHLNPATDFYKRLALECSSQQIAVDLFIVNSQYVDVATISGISRFSGGSIYHFPLFKATRRLQNESFGRYFRRYVTRKIGFEAVMRVRCTRGLAIHSFHGHFFVRSTDLLSLPNINPDAGFGMQLSIEESLSDVQTVCFQAALLYTSSKGERRIRVHTLCLPVASTLTDVINSADQQCIVGLLAKMAVDRSMQSSLSDAREALVNAAIDILSSYKLSLNMGTPTSGLLAPKCLQLLPLYISALLRFTAFRTGTSTRLDDRVRMMCEMKSRPLNQLMQMIYPDLYPIHNLEQQGTILNAEDEPVPLPPRLQLTSRNLDSNGAFLLDICDHMIILVCAGVSPRFLNEALGVPDFNSIGDDMIELPILENECNERLNCFVNYLNEDKPFPATLQVIRDNGPNRNVFYERLIEDRFESALSYHEFLQHLKTQVK